MPDYTKSIIYKLCCKDTTIEDIYIGSTTNFYDRKAQHKRTLRYTDKQIPAYIFIRDNGGWDNWDMIMIREVNCNSKLELHKEERKTIEELKPTLNHNIPGRTKKEYREDPEKKAHYKKWINDNKEILKQKRRVKVECEVCHKLMVKGSLKRHLKNIHSV
jgi:hypothetical protein